jgi:hypothetical protein
MFEALHILVEEIHAAGMHIEFESLNSATQTLWELLARSEDKLPFEVDATSAWVGAVWLVDFTRLSDIDEHRFETIELEVECGPHI